MEPTEKSEIASALEKIADAIAGKGPKKPPDWEDVHVAVAYTIKEHPKLKGLLTHEELYRFSADIHQMLKRT